MFKRFVDFYLKHAGFVGFLYGVVPVVICFSIMFCSIPFRSVYILRFFLALISAGAVGAFLNAYGLSFWLLKHRSASGPATVLDGMFIGAAIGVGITVIPPLTSLIQTNHLEMAKWFIIASWGAGGIVGFLWGGLVTVLGKSYISREQPTPEVTE